MSNCRISQVIQYLEAVKTRHGDLEVAVLNHFNAFVGICDMGVRQRNDTGRRYLDGDTFVGLTEYALGDEVLESWKP